MIRRRISVTREGRQFNNGSKTESMDIDFSVTDKLISSANQALAIQYLTRSLEAGG